VRKRLRCSKAAYSSQSKRSGILIACRILPATSRRFVGVIAMTGRYMAKFVNVALSLGYASSAFAQSGEHGDGHAEGHDWYGTLKSQLGWSCCNGNKDHGDCRPVQARSRMDGQWEAYYSGGWHLIPPETILGDELNKDPLHAHICEQYGFVYCFLKGRLGG
jgi:hypothetical protein